MAHEIVPKRVNMSLFTAIETCCQHVADLKVSMNQSFCTLQRDVGNISSSYQRIEQRMDALEKVVNSMTRCENHRHQCCEEVLKKINSVENLLKTISVGNRSSGSLNNIEESSSDIPASPIVLIRNNKPAQVSASLCLDSTVQVITLNSESDYPDGSWLGDETNPELRVRCPISPPNLLHINTFCQTPEKMAVTLLDYLFSREVLAISNLSGKGKHGKRQLDPLMVIHTTQGDIKVLHATPEQLVRIQETRHIQVLSEDLILPVLRDYPQMLVGADDEDGTSEQVLTIGEQNLTIPASGMNIDVNEVDINATEFVEVQDSSMTSQVLDNDDELTLHNAHSDQLQAFVSIQ
ncbi:Protein BANP [Gryllus bimaculatus]|nr:Protein BANP [Gryllus bimaculatus]